MPLYQKSVVAKYLKSQNKEDIASKWKSYNDHFLNPRVQEEIRELKEEQYQGEFLEDLFVKILGYTKPASSSETKFNLTTEYKNVKDSKKADGAIIFEDKVKAVIELKGTNTTDLGKIEVQAFGYKNNQPDCVYVITSNFEKLRFYIDNAIEHIEFNLFTLTVEEFQLLYICLGFDNLSKNIAKKIKDESLSEEDVITKKLYKDYSLFKSELHQNLVLLNLDFEPLILFKKSQKLIDRFLFLFFGEDRHLLPPNSVRLILSDWRDLQERDVELPLYDRFKKYFEYLNAGYKGKRYDVFAYNGGLFKPDEVLDTIKIDDELLYRHTFKLSEYDFASEVDVNILGHIFENSLNELDEIKAQLEGGIIDKATSKRKKDGVFYTPKYITKYIVDNTIGKLCAEKKTELNIIEEDYFTDKKRQKKTIQPLLEKLTTYRNWLLQLTICDPACGSGAFLNQALDFLINEHKYIDELQAKLFGDAFVLSDVEKSILENNLFGVDLNEESVEIAKLSLWLRTAQPNRKLNDLNNNIKCGNSLIEDVAIAGDKAFNWQTEFPKIFEKGGFDVVIGNPPYVSLESISELEKIYYRKNFDVLERKYDTSVIFKLNSLQLLKKNGFLGFITTVTWQTGENYIKVREHFLNNFNLKEIINLPFNVFEDAYVDTGIVIFKKCNNTKLYRIYCFEKNKTLMSLDGLEFENISIENIDKNKWKIILNSKTQDIYNKQIKNPDSITLGEISISTQGLSPSRFEIFKENNFENSFFPYMVNGHIYQYQFIENEIGYTDMSSKNTLKQFYENIPKILIRRLINRQDRLTVSYTEKKMVFKKDVNPFIITNTNFNPKYILSILASKLISYLYVNTSSIATKDDFRQTTLSEIRNLPILKIPYTNQQSFIQKADIMLSLNKELQEVSQKFQRALEREFSLDSLSNKLQDWYLLSFAEFIKELEKKKVKLSLSQKAEWETYFLQEAKKAQDLKTTIDTTDKQIDQMVYELYGLTEEEIKIVENS